MLQRLRVLQDAAATARPTRLLPHLWVAGAVEANSLHVLRHLGITHILNATEDLLLPEPDAAFMCTLSLFTKRLMNHSNNQVLQIKLDIKQLRYLDFLSGCRS